MPSTCTLTNLEGLSSSLSCSLIDYKIILTDPFEAEYENTGDSIMLTLEGIKLPNSTAPTLNATFTTYTRVGGAIYLVDNSTYVNLFQPGAGLFDSITVTPDST